MIINELWIHKSKNIMCEYFYEPYDLGRRYLRFSNEVNGFVLVGEFHPFYAYSIIVDVGLNNRVIFPNDFEKIGDI